MQKLNLELKRTISKRQSKALQLMSDASKAEYLLTFMGRKNQWLKINKPETDEIFTGKFGKVYNRKGQMLNEFLRKNEAIYNTNRTKIPTDSRDGWIGVEIECFLPKDHFSANSDCTCEHFDNCGAYEDEDCDCDYLDNCNCGDDYISSARGYFYKKMVKNIALDDDGSLEVDDSDYFSVEIKVLTRIDDLSNLKKLCGILASLKATVNKTCGLHVHLDVSNKFDKFDGNMMEKLAIRLFRALPILTKMLPVSRLDNNYCRYGYSFDERYSMINCTSIKKYGTIEVRAHSGTVSFDKISEWIKILYAVRNTEFSNDCTKLTDFFNLVVLDESTKTYIKERISTFNAAWLESQTGFELVAESTMAESSEAA